MLSNPQVSAVVAPDFNLKDVNGGDVKLGDLKDKVVLANFWAHSVKAARWRFRGSWNFRKSMRIGDSLSSVFQWMMTVGNQKSLGSERKCELSYRDWQLAIRRSGQTRWKPLTALVDRDGRIADLHFRRTSAQCLIGSLALVLVTLVCYRPQWNLAAASFLYLIVVVLLSLTGEFVASVIVSIMAVGL